MDPWVQIVSESLVTLLAAFGGAYFAFAIQSAKEAAKVRAIDAANGNSALFALATIADLLMNLRVDLDEELRRTEGVRELIRPMKPDPQILLEVNVESLSSVLKTEPALMAGVLFAQARVSSLFSVIRLRNDLHVEKVQDALVIAFNSIHEKMRNPSMQDLHDELVATLGPKLEHQNKDMSNEMVEGVDECLRRVLRVHAELRNYLKKTYGESKFIQIEFHNEAYAEAYKRKELDKDG
ncbi:MAG TPA: hypothetical protein VGE64_13145 [Xanthomonadaceae bacterium]